jgi:hypothetical protein
MKGFLDSQGVLLKEFSSYVAKMTGALKAHAKDLAAAADRPYLYLAKTMTKRSGTSKEDLARKIADDDGVTEGLVCVLAAVEGSMSFEVYKNKDTHRLEVRRRPRPCLHFYFYFLDKELGLCHVRLQSWFPFEIQVWVNSREVLSRSLTRRRVPHLRYANAIVKVANFSLAQRLAERLAQRKWHRVLSSLAEVVNPHLPTLCEAGVGPYWWVTDQEEVATDVVFSSRQALEEVLPSLIAHASSAFSAEDVLRFLGRKLHPALAAEVTSDARRRPEGWRVKHRMARNSIKCYDKANVLRVEVTINDPTKAHRFGRTCARWRLKLTGSSAGCLGPVRPRRAGRRLGPSRPLHTRAWDRDWRRGRPGGSPAGCGFRPARGRGFAPGTGPTPGSDASW